MESPKPLSRTATESPFLQPQNVRLGFGTVMLLLLMVVGAGVGLLLYYAARVPAITSELNAWLGRPEVALDNADARRAQVIFALFVYTAPLALGIFVYGLHTIVNLVDRFLRSRDNETDDQFRMDR